MVNQDNVEQAKVFVRLSCQDGINEKHYVVSFYQREILIDGKVVVVQLTWLPKRRRKLSDIKREIEEKIIPLLDNPKYTTKEVIFRGSYWDS